MFTLCRPLVKLIKEEECQRRKNAAAKGRRSSSRSSDYGSNGGAYAANGVNEIGTLSFRKLRFFGFSRFIGRSR
ncbi:hypothetical protein niasHS_012861 [Heterodera schachtii]|uniref:Uncharacterized protein n=1 Tax=Heterodera schachtii TaxID=97005 RepID=A0ABD2I668_HETSC